MTAEEANAQLLEVIKVHLELVQGGHFGPTSENDLRFCGALHTLLEKFGSVKLVLSVTHA